MEISTIRLSLFCIFLVGSLLLSSCDRSSPVVRPKNILLISIDTLRSRELGCYGYERPTSPNLNRLASEGVLFENAFTTSPWTLPAHASLMTGVYPRRHGVFTERQALSKATRTLSEILSEHKFQTAAIVNSYYLTGHYGMDRGFDHFDYVKEIAGYTDSGRIEMVGPESSGVVDKAIGWLLGRKGHPFFLFLHDYHVHSDYSSLPQYEKLFVRPYDGLANGTNAQLVDARHGRFHLDAKDVEHLIDLYSAGIRQVDDDLGRLFDALKESGLWGNTLIVFLSDHGEEFMEHGGVLHGRTQYDEVLRVPMIFHGPGVAVGHRISEPVSIIDVAPTILALLGIQAPTDYEGVNLRRAWNGGAKSSDRDRLFFSEADHNNAIPDMLRSVRFRNYKLIENRRTGESMLFDLTRDPGENHNVIAEHGDVARVLGAEFEKFQAVFNKGQSLPELSPEIKAQLEALGYVR